MEISRLFNKEKSKLVILFIVFLAMIIILGTKYYKKNNIQVPNYQTIISSAQNIQKPVWILFRSKTWTSCVQMGKVFTQIVPTYKNRIAAVEVDVNAKENFALLDKYHVMTIPTSIMLDAEGKLKYKFSGVQDVAAINQKLNDLLKSQH